MEEAERTFGVVKSAALAQRLEGVDVLLSGREGLATQKTLSDENGRWELDHRSKGGVVTFAHPDYTPKSFAVGELPETVRLLEERLIGYQQRLWFRPGEKVIAYVHSPSAFQATLFRHGIEKERIAQFNDLPPSIQEVPDHPFVEHGLDWKPTLEYRIPLDARPGLYSLKLESGSQPPFAAPMVVSTPSDTNRRSDILVLVSTNNWQSYNVWGGRNRYRNFEDEISEPYLRDPNFLTELVARAGKMAPRPLVRGIKKLLRIPQSDPEWKFRPLSIKRPFTNCALEQDDVMQPFTNHLAAGEWRVLAWLEREGFEYDIVSGYELHQNPDLLKHYRATILSTHCEYWSEKMYRGLKNNHLENGLSIINLSGNTLYREVEFQEDGSHRCVSLQFEKSVEDETEVLGVRFTQGDLGTCGPYDVEKPDHWIFQGLDLKRGTRFGEESLNRPTPRDHLMYDPGRPGTESGLRDVGASGWETDKLSKTAPSDFVRVAKGQNRWGGADMVVREPDGIRGDVFSASSITFGGALLIDAVCSGIARNVLARFLLAQQETPE